MKWFFSQKQAEDGLTRKKYRWIRRAYTAVTLCVCITAMAQPVFAGYFDGLAKNFSKEFFTVLVTIAVVATGYLAVMAFLVRKNTTQGVITLIIGGLVAGVCAKPQVIETIGTKILEILNIS